MVSTLTLHGHLPDLWQPLKRSDRSETLNGCEEKHDGRGKASWDVVARDVQVRRQTAGLSRQVRQQGKGVEHGELHGNVQRHCRRTTGQRRPIGSGGAFVELHGVWGGCASGAWVNGSTRSPGQVLRNGGLMLNAAPGAAPRSLRSPLRVMGGAVGGNDPTLVSLPGAP
jgi:hypothetical protein